MATRKRKQTGTESLKKHVKPNSNQVHSNVENVPKSKQRRANQMQVDEDDEEIDQLAEDSSVADSQSSDDNIVDASSMNPAKITIPCPRGAPFADAVAPDVLTFLAELTENNHRDFMQIQQDRWKSTRKDFMDFVGMLSEQLRDLDATVLSEEPRHAIYRQNRDLRFTNDLRPYKTHLSASFSRGGKKSPFAGYHISVAPGDKTYIAAGIWQPGTAITTRMRQGMIDTGGLMREALETDMVRDVLGQTGLDVLEQTDKLKVAPKGISRDHPEIDLLRFKSMVVSKTFTDAEVVSSGFLEKVLDVYEALVPFIAVLNSWTG